MTIPRSFSSRPPHVLRSFFFNFELWQLSCGKFPKYYHFQTYSFLLISIIANTLISYFNTCVRIMFNSKLLAIKLNEIYQEESVSKRDKFFCRCNGTGSIFQIRGTKRSGIQTFVTLEAQNKRFVETGRRAIKITTSDSISLERCNWTKDRMREVSSFLLTTNYSKSFLFSFVGVKKRSRHRMVQYIFVRQIPTLLL